MVTDSGAVWTEKYKITGDVESANEEAADTFLAELVRIWY